MKNKKNQILISIVLIVVLVLITVGVSLSLFNYVKEGSTENVLTTSSITFIYQEIDKQGAGIVIENAYPISDDLGKLLSDSNQVFNFTVKSETSNKISTPYTVTVRKKSDSTLREDAVKIYLTEVVANEEEEILLDLYSNLSDYKNKKDNVVEKVIYTDVVKGNEEYQKDFRLRMWIDEGVDFSDGSLNNKKFSITVNVYASGEVIENDGVYYDVDSVIDSFNEEELKEVVMCSDIEGNNTLYYDCGVYETIEDALAGKDKGTIILTSDINRSSNITIKEGSDITLELNGRSITFTENYAILNSGKLNINESSKTGTISGYSRAIVTYGITNIYNGQYINTIETNDGAGTFLVAKDGTLNIYGDRVTFDENGNYLSGTYIKGRENSAINTQLATTNIYGGTIEMTGELAAVRSNYDDTATINMYDGEIIGEYHGIGLDPNCPETSEVNIYGGNITVNQYWAVYNNSVGTINVYGGVFTSNASYTILNRSTGVININQTEKPLYITSLSESFYPAVANGLGTLNIDGNEANKCTGNSSDTTSGLCIYSPNSANGGVALSGDGETLVGGVLNINGGTIYGGNVGVSNHFDGTININGGNITGGILGSYNSRTGTINMHGGIITGITNSAFKNTGTGIINIDQKDNPLYITSLAETWQPAVRNSSTGTINISGSEADRCTNNSSDTTSGLCIYAEGDKNYESNTSNAAVSNTGETGGIININGGTMYGGQNAISNHYNGTVNIKSGKLLSGNFAVYNIRDGNINICNAKISAPTYDLRSGATTTGLINYSPSVIFTSGNNTPVVGGSIPSIAVGNYTGTCISE